MLIKWNDREVDAEQFIESEEPILQVKTRDKVSLIGAQPFSFELPMKENIIYEEYPNLVAHSFGALATQGPWFIEPHIKWGGGESVASLISDSKLWIFTAKAEISKMLYAKEFESFDAIYRLLSSGAPSPKQALLLSNYYYHLVEPGDLIVQPAFATHCVSTETTFDRSGQPKLALVSGYEAIDLRVEDRGRRPFDNYAAGFPRGKLCSELKLHGFGNFLRLMKIRDYRRAFQDCQKAGGTDFLDFYSASNFTTHLKVLFDKNYDLQASLENADLKFNKSAEKSRLANLKRDKLYESCLVDVTEEEKL